jgi:hypothetical protein
MKQHKLHFTTW